MKDFPAIVVANYFVERAREAKQEIGILKLIKLVYLAHGWHLGLYGIDRPLIREDVEGSTDPLSEAFMMLSRDTANVPSKTRRRRESRRK